MPKGPKGQKRPGDVVGAAVMVGKIATGEIEEETQDKAQVRKAGKKGGASRTRKLTPEKRSEIARIAAAARWKKAR